MNTIDKQIASTLARYGVPQVGNVWQAEGQVFIRHKALERIAADAKITFDAPTIFVLSATKLSCWSSAAWVSGPSGPLARHLLA